MIVRTQDFAVRIVKLVAALPNGRIFDVLGKQILKSGTSIGANYREAVRASSRRHFVTNLEVVQREADETLYWLDLLSETELVKPNRLTALKTECNELLSIITATIRTTKKCTPDKHQKPKFGAAKS